MNYKYLFIVILVSSIYISVTPLWGYEVSKTSGADIKWPSTSVTYRINASSGPSGSQTALQAALQEWSDVSTSNFSFVYGGTTASTSYGMINENGGDGENIILFGSFGAGYESTLGLNTYIFYSTGQLVESDIKFNTAFTWGTDGSGGVYDVQNIGTHELGHSLSLADLYDDADFDKTMYGYGSSGETQKRTLHQDDKNGITYLYPGPSACISHDYSACYADHVYWYDSCDEREDKKQTCLCTSSVEADPYCSNGSIYEDSCNYGCSSGICYSNAGSQKIEDCGETEYTTGNYCCGNNVCRDKIIRSCVETAEAECYESDETPEVIKICGEGCADGKCDTCEIDSMFPESFDTVFWFFGTFCLNDTLPAIVFAALTSSDENFDNTDDVWVEHTGTTVLWQNPAGQDTVIAMLLVSGACYPYRYDIYVGDCKGEGLFVLNGWMME